MARGDDWRKLKAGDPVIIPGPPWQKKEEWKRGFIKSRDKGSNRDRSVVTVEDPASGDMTDEEVMTGHIEPCDCEDLPPRLRKLGPCLS